MAVAGILKSQKDLENMMDPMGLDSRFNVPTSIHAKIFDPEIENDENKRIQTQQADVFISDANSTPSKAYSNLLNGTSNG